MAVTVHGTDYLQVCLYAALNALCLRIVSFGVCRGQPVEVDVSECSDLGIIYCVL